MRFETSSERTPQGKEKEKRKEKKNENGRRKEEEEEEPIGRNAADTRRTVMQRLQNGVCRGCACNRSGGCRAGGACLAVVEGECQIPQVC